MMMMLVLLGDFIRGGFFGIFKLVKENNLCGENCFWFVVSFRVCVLRECVWVIGFGGLGV